MTNKGITSIKLIYPVFVYLVTALVGVLVAPDLFLALNRLWVLLLGVIGFFSVVVWANTPRRVMLIAIGVVVLGVAMALFSMVATDWRPGVLVEWSEVYTRIPQLLRPGGSGVPNAAEGVHPRAVGGAMALLLPLPLALAIFGRGRSLRLLGGVAAFVMALPLLLSQSPQALLGLSLGLLVIMGARRPWVLLPTVLFAVSAWAAWHAWRWWLPQKLVDRLQIGIDNRLMIWQWALLMFRDMPFSGVGLNNLPVIEPFYLVTLWPIAHAHNVFLQTGIDQGGLGLVAFLAIFVLAFWMGWRAYRGSDDPNLRTVMLGCLGGCAAYLGFGLWDSMVLGNRSALAVWLLLGLLVAGYRLVVVEAWMPALKTWWKWALVAITLVVVLMIPLLRSAFLVNVARQSFHRAMLHGEENELLSRAEAIAHTALRYDDENSRAYVLAGLVVSAQEQERKAIELLEQALELDGSDSYAHFQLAELYYKHGEKEMAQIHWKATSDTKSLLVRGWEAYKMKNYREAVIRFQTVMQIDPGNMEGWIGLGSAQAAQGEATHAAKTFQEVINRFPDEPTGYQALAKLYLWVLQDEARARQMIEQGFTHSESPGAELYYLRSIMMGREGKSSAAISDSMRAIELAPTNGLYVAWLGDLYTQQGRYNEALTQYELLSSLVFTTDWQWRMHQRKGKVYATLQECTDAQQEFHQAIQISLDQNGSPKNLAGLYAYLGEILEQCGDTAGAIGSYQEALKLDPQNQSASFYLNRLQP